MTTNEIDTFDIEKEEEDSEEVLIEYDIATYPSDNTLEVLVRMWSDKDITIPDFQRGFVWTIKQSSKLIESFLIGLPVPPVFFYIDKENKNLVVDGQQRLLSIVYFFEGYFGAESEKGKRQVFKLTGLNSHSPFHNKRYLDLTEAEKRKLNSAVLRAVNIRQLSPREENTSIYHIFERLNTGGTPLTSQEIRNVVFRGKFLNWLKVLNKDPDWRAVLGKETADKHQKDVELILRAFALNFHLDSYEKPMTEFLNRICRMYRNSDSKNIRTFTTDFKQTCIIIRDSLTPKPFNIRGPFNTSVFDSVFCVINNNLDTIPPNLAERYRRLIGDGQFYNYTSLGTTDPRTIKERFSLVKSILID
jgi:hypothetical protein